jgi:hypothetical protein
VLQRLASQASGVKVGKSVGLVFVEGCPDQNLRLHSPAAKAKDVPGEQFCIGGSRLDAYRIKPLCCVSNQVAK